MIRKIFTGGEWKPLNPILPDAPDPSDPRGEATPFHGRYRSAHNTGVPDKSALAPAEFGLTVTTPDVTFSDRHFIGTVDVQASGVTFERCYFESKIGDLFTFTAGFLTTLIDCEAYGGKERGNTVVVTGKVHAIRCNIWGGANDTIGFDDGALFEDCYLHSPVEHYGTHSDVAQTLTADNIGIIRCKLMGYDAHNGHTQNSVIQLGGTVDGMDIIDNYLDGAGYCINGNVTLPTTHNFSITGNRFGRHSTYGPMSLLAPPGTTDGTNVMDNNNQVVNP